jgi:DNA-binding NarL/FixJ family response regulator
VVSLLQFGLAFVSAVKPNSRKNSIVLTTFDDDELVFDGLRAGAIGYLLKDTPSEKLCEAIRSAARGESFLQPSVAAKVVAEFARPARKPEARPPALI